MATSDFRDLIVWQKSLDLVEEIYYLSKLLPKDETYGLINQIRRAATSIPSNIAEGNARQASKDYSRFLNIARGSKAEVETQLEICIRVNYLTRDQTIKAFGLCNEVGRMLYAMIQNQKDF